MQEEGLENRGGGVRGYCRQQAVRLGGLGTWAVAAADRPGEESGEKGSWLQQAAAGGEEVSAGGWRDGGYMPAGCLQQAYRHTSSLEGKCNSPAPLHALTIVAALGLRDVADPLDELSSPKVRPAACAQQSAAPQQQTLDLRRARWWR